MVIPCNFRPKSLFKAEDLSSFEPDGKVFMDVCSPLTPVQLMLDRNSKKVRDCFTCPHTL